MKKIYWIPGIIAIPLIIIGAVLFFSVAAVIVLGIIGLVILLSCVVYINRKFKYAISQINSSAQKKEKTAEKKSKRTGKEHEVIIQDIEEREKHDKK